MCVCVMEPTALEKKLFFSLCDPESFFLMDVCVLGGSGLP